jgi:hypothetical protein
MCDGECDPRWIGASIPFEHWHFHRQLLRRYGIVLAPGEFSYIRWAIEKGGAQLIERRKGGRAIYSVRLPLVRKRIYILVTEGGEFVTAWPPMRRLNVIRRRLKAGTAE